ncbi:MAG TPA: malto-oligosyltrehalose trehalohydrolase [Vicinamibacterales bacterium]|nr:malto-oligosyltrehalose trehalohydrolase [Vicinamibacterales bacterium]
MGTLGAVPGPDSTSFRLVAPATRRVRLRLENGPGPIDLDRLADGVFGARVPGVGAGAQYRYQLDEGYPMPDPASRYQPHGVHGPSEVIDPLFAWTDEGWKGPDPAALRIYELHVGTFSGGGSFEAVAARLAGLVDLGVNAIELMPVTDFPGWRNWGYDPAALFAPARCYGRPDDLRRLVDEAHRHRLAVLLDLVYNHLGPDGAYLPAFLPSFFSRDREGPWGRAVNLDGPGSEWVRWFIVENARYWVREFHVDGLRLDATHGLEDTSPRHLVQELAAAVHDDGRAAGRRVVVIAEDERNLDLIVRDESEGGFGLDGVWADDFHHQVRSATAGDDEGYYRDYTGAAADLAATARQGWFYTGQRSAHTGEPRGTDPRGLPPQRFVYCIQNHDQVGNRALGERLAGQVDLPTYLAASMLLLVLPETPLLFMGQEWAASTPFLFFTDHGEELGRLVTEGRRREFKSFSAFADPAARERIPDPQAPGTFEASRLDWDEAEREPHAGVRRFYRRMLALRAGHPLLGASIPMRIEPAGDACLWVRRDRPGGASLAAVLRLKGSGPVDLPVPHRSFVPVLVTEDAAFLDAPAPITWDWRDHGKTRGLTVGFARPGGVIFEAR